jgi:hypothetical protein
MECFCRSLTDEKSETSRKLGKRKVDETGKCKDGLEEGKGGE